MKLRVESLDNIKRTIYTLASIFILIYLLGNLLSQYNTQQGNVLVILLIVYFTMSFGLLLLKKPIFLRYHELTNIALITIYLIGEFYSTLKVEFSQLHTQSLGDFIIWLPLYTIYLFLVLGKRYGLISAFLVFILHLLIGVPFFNHLTADQLDSLIHYYVASLIYIVVIYSFQYIVSTYAEYEALKRSAYMDGLTEIPNRRKSTMIFEELILKAQETNTPFSIIFLDIDHFKMINDRFGHDIGDSVLKEVATHLSQLLSKNEFVGRWGGEEFIIFTPRLLPSAISQAENLRTALETTEFTEVKSVTCSLGVASYSKGDTVDSLFKRADLALYHAKEKGRNRVMSY